MAATMPTIPEMTTSAASMELATLAWNSAIIVVRPVTSVTISATRASETTTAYAMAQRMKDRPKCWTSSFLALLTRHVRLKSWLQTRHLRHLELFLESWVCS
eukprot:scaffold53580_cov65-Phaeocystis_antarctica.AAC.7